jgi:hypothetical protein
MRAGDGLLCAGRRAFGAGDCASLADGQGPAKALDIIDAMARAVAAGRALNPAMLSALRAKVAEMGGDEPPLAFGRAFRGFHVNRGTKQLQSIARLMQIPRKYHLQSIVFASSRQSVTPRQWGMIVTSGEDPMKRIVLHATVSFVALGLAPLPRRPWPKMQRCCQRRRRG